MSEVTPYKNGEESEMSMKQLRREFWDRRWRELGRVFVEPTPAEIKARKAVIRKRGPQYWRKQVYGLTEVDYRAMRARQQDRCLICNRHESSLKKPLQIDHHHRTGKVRGLLCYGCNVVIGMAREDPQVLKMCALYLEIHAQYRG